MKRPQKIYEDLFKAQGCFYEQDEHAITIEGTLKPGNYTLPGNVSSQFISGLLFILPLLGDDSRIHIENTFESKSYVLLTLQMLEEFGVKSALRMRIHYILKVISVIILMIPLWKVIFHNLLSLR